MTGLTVLGWLFVLGVTGLALAVAWVLLGGGDDGRDSPARLAERVASRTQGTDRGVAEGRVHRRPAPPRIAESSRGKRPECLF